MKFILFIFFLFSFSLGFSQEKYTDSTKLENYAGKHIQITTKSGESVLGQLLEIDDKTIGLLLENNKMRYLDKAEIDEIKTSLKNVSQDSSMERYPYQYFAAPSYFGMEKGTNYMKFSLFGPEYNYAVSDKFLVGVKMSWISSPLVFTSKYVFSLGKKVQFGVGADLGWGGYFSFGSFALIPYSGFTFGSETSNFSISYGMGFGPDFTTDQGNFPSIFTLSGMHKMKDGVNLMFEAVIGGIIAEGNFPFILLTPGLRFPRKNERSFQVSVATVIADGIWQPFPIPSLSWYFYVR